MVPPSPIAATGALALVVLARGAVAVRGQAVHWPSESPLRPLSQREAEFPPYQGKALANGMQVVTVSQREQPSVSVRLLVRAGGVHKPAGRPLGAAPVLVLATPDDRLIPIRGIRSTAARYGATLQEFPGMGHDLMLDARWREPFDAMIGWLRTAVPAS